MISISDLLIQSLEKVWITFSHTWPFLLVSILISVGLRLYINSAQVSAFLTRYRRVGVIGATAVAVGTPLCSGGTTAVILGMMANTIPWAPIVAFMVASPLTSPEELVYSAGLFGWPFAIAFFVSSILLGLLGGILAEFFESRGWLANQARFAMQAAPTGVAALDSQKLAAAAEDQGGSGGSARVPVSQTTLVRDIRADRPVQIANSALALGTCGGPAMATVMDCSCRSVPVATLAGSCACGTDAHPSLPEGPFNPAVDDQRSAIPGPQPVTTRRWIEEMYRTSKQLLVMFVGFAFIGYVLNGLIPPAWVAAIFGKGNAYSVPLAATLGLPFYINTEGSLPLVRALIDNGMSQGAALAFLISGAGTSAGAIAGALTIARWRVIALVVGTLWMGAIVLGYAYDLLLFAHLF
jgi:uncharacterized membrane protein YraQ (UPF0718 family)